jgi:DNA-binding FadR family transcriptional regulator
MTTATRRVRAATRRVEKKSEVLARTIVADILARRLQPGTTLPPEAAMLRDYDVGRTTLREALRILEVQGMLGIRPGPGGGPVVAEPSSRSYARTSSLFFQASGVRLIDVMEARLAVEPMLARRAAENRDPVAAQRLRQVAERFESTSANGSDFGDAAKAMHLAITDMAGNPVLGLFCRALDDLVAERMERFAYPARKRPLAVARQVAICRAVLRGNAAAAERLMREHMQDYNQCAAEGRGGGIKSVVSWG